MSILLYWYAIPGTSDVRVWVNSPWENPDPGYIVMEQRPETGPTPYGVWWANANGDGGWYWVPQPAPPKTVVTYDGALHQKVANPDLTESLIPFDSDEWLPTLAPKEWVEDFVDGVVSGVESDISSVESTLASLTSQLTATSTALSTTNSTLTSVQAMAQSSIKKADVVDITIPSGQTSATVSIGGYSQVSAVIPVPTWSGDQMVIPGITNYTNTSISIVGKRTKGTLILSAGPMESTSGSFKVIVLGK